MFVAGFVGSPKINFILAEVRKKDEELSLVCEDLHIELPQYEEKLIDYVDQKVVIGIRPEDILVMKTGENQQPFTCVLERYEHLGNKIHLFVKYGSNTLCVVAPVSVRAKVGQTLTVYLDKNKIHLFDEASQVRL